MYISSRIFCIRCICFFSLCRPKNVSPVFVYRLCVCVCVCNCHQVKKIIPFDKTILYTCIYIGVIIIIDSLMIHSNSPTKIVHCTSKHFAFKTKHQLIWFELFLENCFCPIHSFIGHVTLGFCCFINSIVWEKWTMSNKLKGVAPLLFYSPWWLLTSPSSTYRSLSIIRNELVRVWHLV